MTFCHIKGAVALNKSIFTEEVQVQKGGATLYFNICNAFF